MEYILDLVSYDVLSLLRKSDSSGVDFGDGHKQLLISLRSNTRRLRNRLSRDGWDELLELNLQSSTGVGFVKNNTRPISTLSISAFVYDASAHARIIIKNIMQASNVIIKNGSEPDTIKSNIITKHELMYSYLDWFSDFLELILDNKLDNSAYENCRAMFDDFKNEMERYERDRAIGYILTSIGSNLDEFTSRSKSEARAFIDQTLTAVSAKISENTMSAASSIEQFKVLTKEFENIRKKQSEYFEDIETVHEYCNSRKSSIDSIFTAANRQGMANSFSVMANSLIRPIKFWGGTLILSLFIIFVAGFMLEENFFKKEGYELLAAIFLKLLLASPLIWLAWFSGRQFIHASKLRQDYLYKSAVAMAYQGYKDEATTLSSDMHEKLLENIILHFSDNPVRLYDKNDSTSPIEDIIKKISPEKLSEIIRSIRG